MIDLSFYKNKKVLITGHTGFKGAWLVSFLHYLNADVYGYALKPQDKSLYNIMHLDNKMHSYIGDIRDYDNLLKVFNEIKPEIVIHMAAQAIVKKGYEDPKYTYETNVLGTINILECIRNSNCVKAFINITTDKVYENKDSYVYKEDDRLNGYDPYSNSKSCIELIADTYYRCYLKDKLGLVNLRSGNVIGGGDFSDNRIIPDCFKAYLNNEDIIIRNPKANRPYQHVLEALYMYLLIGKEVYNDYDLSDSYNIGPNKQDVVDNKKLVEMFCETFNKKYDVDLNYIIKNDNGPHEANTLYLDTTKIKEIFNYQSTITLNQAIDEVIDFAYKYKNKMIDDEYCFNVINDYMIGNL